MRCSICGESSFIAGPSGRHSSTGKLPRCAACGSLERHRAAVSLLRDVREDLRRLDEVEFWRMKRPVDISGLVSNSSDSFEGLLQGVRRASLQGLNCMVIADYPGTERLAKLLDVAEKGEQKKGGFLLNVPQSVIDRKDFVLGVRENEHRIIDQVDYVTEENQHFLALGSAVEIFSDSSRGRNPRRDRPKTGPEVAPTLTFEPDEFEGACSVCGHWGRFERRERAIRETYKCDACGASLRYQAQAQVIADWLGNPEVPLADRRNLEKVRGLRIYEPGIAGPFRRLLACARRYESSYYWDNVKLGESVSDVQCQDIHNLTFEDSSFDLIVSSDIFEHVRHPNQGFREVHRVLVPNGVHIFTVPAQLPLRETTVERVDVSGSEDKYLLEKRYHGSPTGEPSLVYNDFGRDLTNLLANIGFSTNIIPGHFASPIASTALTFFARKVDE